MFLKERVDPMKVKIGVNGTASDASILLQRCLAFVEAITNLPNEMISSYDIPKSPLCMALDDTHLVGIISLLISMLVDGTDGGTVVETLPDDMFNIAGVGVKALINIGRISLPLLQVRYSLTHTYIYIYTQTFSLSLSHIYIIIYVCMYMCIYVCMK